MPDQGRVRRICVAGPHVAIELAQATRGIMPTTAAMTIIEQDWALCAAGQADGHVWRVLDPKVTVIEALTLIARSRDDATVSLPDGLNQAARATTNP